MKALKELPSDGDVRRGEVIVNLVGRCEFVLGWVVREMARDFSLESVVRLPGPVSRRDALRYLGHSDLLLLLAENLTTQIPGKTYEYLRAGRPLLALAPEGATADVIRATRARGVIAPDDVPGIVAAIRQHVKLRRAGVSPGGADPTASRRLDRRALVGPFAAIFSRPAYVGGASPPGTCRS